LVENGSIAFEETNPQLLCLVAVAYHNLAVIQLKLQVPDAACKNSQNARKIARLCLSHSNRWINTFHWTHQIALEDAKYLLRDNLELDDQQRKVVADLTEMIFDPFPT
jgi:hypothetical protein